MADVGDERTVATMRRDRLHASAVHYFKAGGPTEPEVALLCVDGTRYVLKDYGRGQGWFMRFIAPILIWREASALEALRGVAGVPQLLRRLDSRGLLIEYCPAKPWAEVRPDDAAYGRLEALIGQIHAYGIAHCDLRGGGNFLVDATGQPFVVDFVARVRRGRVWNLPWNWLFSRLVAVDGDALIKLRARHAPHLLSAVDRARLAHRGGVDRAVRRFTEQVRRLTRRLATRD